MSAANMIVVKDTNKLKGKASALVSLIVNTSNNVTIMRTLPFLEKEMLLSTTSAEVPFLPNSV